MILRQIPAPPFLQPTPFRCSRRASSPRTPPARPAHHRRPRCARRSRAAARRRRPPRSPRCWHKPRSRPFLPRSAADRDPRRGFPPSPAPFAWRCRGSASGIPSGASSRSTRRTASIARAAPGRPPMGSGTDSSSARTAPRRWRTRDRRHRIGADFFAEWSIDALAGQSDALAQCARPPDAADAPAGRVRPLRADRLGGGIRPDRSGAARAAPRPTPRPSTPRAAPATRRRSSISSSCGSSAPTTFPTAPTCVTSRRARPWSKAWGSARGR